MYIYTIVTEREKKEGVELDEGVGYLGGLLQQRPGCLIS